MGTRRDFLSIAGAASIFATNRGFQSPLFAQTLPCGIEATDYGLLPGLIYLNTGSAGPTPRAVLEKTIEAWALLETNPVLQEYSTNGVFGQAEKVRQQAASFLGCTSDELLLTRSTSEAMNTVAQGTRLKTGDRVLTTDQEHAGGSDCWRYLAERRGIVIDKVVVPQGERDPQALVQRFADGIRPDTRVISVSHVLYTTGLRMPVTDISALARSHKILCVVDGAQAAGATPIDVKAIGCHAYATNAHKWLMGPKGVGMLYVSSDAVEDIKPIQWTGGRKYIDNSVGAGPLPLVVGLGAALETANRRGVAKIEEHNLALRQRAYQGLSQIAAVKMMSLPSGPLTSALLSVAFPPDRDSHTLQLKLHDKYQIVTRHIGEQPFNGLRISPHIFNTEADIDALIAALRVELS
ncbi:MAG TPA: aminotransferase class V-fold PLP-dependent enzyme [Terriglobales bacterium]|nr:aminotransferase class V-fold PLP-dependent enzyme [Terriglobales bacterium]